MVVAVQQPSAEYTAILTACIVDVKHRPPPCAMTIQKTCTHQHWNGFQDSALIQDQRSMCWQHTKQLDLNQ